MVQELIESLVVEEALLPAWRSAGPPPTALHGLAGAVSGGRGAAVVVTDRALSDAEAAALGDGLAATLGVPLVELVALNTLVLPDLLRQWVNQAAQGAGRGVGVRVPPPAGHGPGGPVTVLVRAIDSSARELELRLASPTEPALPALSALLGRQVVVRDEEAPTG